MKNLTINVGDYVRFYDRNWTEIAQIVGEVEDSHLKVVKCRDGYYDLDGFIKSSPNIIDLIVVGDVLLIDISPDDCGGIVVLRSIETENDIKRYKSKFENKEYILKGIITHEQIESMVYKIER